MVTKEQALTAQDFHCGPCRRSIGPRGGVKESSEAWRRNGATKTWKTRPNEFRVPLKHGLYDYGELTDGNAHLFHTAEDCPLLKTDGEVS